MEQMVDKQSAAVRVIARFMKRVIQRKAESRNVFGWMPTTHTGPKGLEMGGWGPGGWIPICDKCGLDVTECTCEDMCDNDHVGPCRWCGRETEGSDEAYHGFCSRDCMKEMS